MNGLGATVLVLATIATGLTAGVFWIYGNAIMPGLRATDDRTFVGAFQSLDRAIINPLFMTVFMGALLLSGAAAVLHLPDDERSVLPWAIAAFVLYLLVFVITVGVNVPMNDRIKAATASAGAYSGPCLNCVGGRIARTATDVTAEIEGLLARQFGPIPSQCRSN